VTGVFAAAFNMADSVVFLGDTRPAFVLFFFPAKRALSICFLGINWVKMGRITQGYACGWLTAV